MSRFGAFGQSRHGAFIESAHDARMTVSLDIVDPPPGSVFYLTDARGAHAIIFKAAPQLTNTAAPFRTLLSRGPIVDGNVNGVGNIDGDFDTAWYTETFSILPGGGLPTGAPFIPTGLFVGSRLVPRVHKLGSDLAHLESPIFYSFRRAEIHTGEIIDTGITVPILEIIGGGTQYVICRSYNITRSYIAESPWAGARFLIFSWSSLIGSAYRVINGVNGAKLYTYAVTIPYLAGAPDMYQRLPNPIGGIFTDALGFGGGSPSIIYLGGETARYDATIVTPQTGLHPLSPPYNCTGIGGGSLICYAASYTAESGELITIRDAQMRTVRAVTDNAAYRAMFPSPGAAGPGPVGCGGK